MTVVSIVSDSLFSLVSMAKKAERGIFVMIVKNFVKSFMPRTFSGELKGTDHFGNKYFEISAGGNRSKRSRYFEPIGKEDGFDAELPAEWESWLRGRRGQPPTDEEVMANYQLMLDKKKKALEIEQKFKGLKKDQLELTAGDIKKRTAFPEYADYEHMPGSKPSSKQN